MVTFLRKRKNVMFFIKILKPKEILKMRSFFLKKRTIFWPNFYVFPKKLRFWQSFRFHRNEKGTNRKSLKYKWNSCCFCQSVGISFMSTSRKKMNGSRITNVKNGGNFSFFKKEKCAPTQFMWNCIFLFLSTQFVKLPNCIFMHGQQLFMCGVHVIYFHKFW